MSITSRRFCSLFKYAFLPSDKLEPSIKGDNPESVVLSCFTSVLSALLYLYLYILCISLEGFKFPSSGTKGVSLAKPRPASIILFNKGKKLELLFFGIPIHPELLGFPL